MKYTMIALLVTPLCILGFSMISVLAEFPLDSLRNSGPHGLTEIIYAYARFGVGQWLGLRRPQFKYAMD